MDLSDGLADAVRQMAAASGAGIEIDAAALPIAAAVRRWHEARGVDAVAAALRGGDDYELLFTARPAHQGRLRGARRALGDLPITRIGVVTREPRVVLRAADGARELPEGFEHFR
jgi:thiamine-monophosphate kinase